MFVGNIKNLRHVSQAFAGKRSKELFSPLDLTKKHHNLKEAAYKFTDEEIITKAAHYDQTVEFPWDIIKKAHANGFMNSEIPVEYGGLALDLLSNVLISEAIGYGCTGIGNAILSNELAATPIIIGGSAEIKKKYLGLLINEPVMASYCVTERGAGSDVAGLNAVKQGKDWVINGSKMWITNGGVASWFFVLARTAPDPKVPNEKAFTAFVVDGDAKGLSRGKKEINLGHRCFDTRGITFEHVVVPSSNVIGIPGEGFKIAMKTFDKTRPIVAALAVGLASRALDEAAKYSFETKTFEPPIANNQLISFLLADMAMSLEHSRLMTYKIAQEVDLGRPGAYWASLAKCFAAAAANQTLSNVDMILGGNGFNTELQVEKLLQDLKCFRQYHYIILPEDYNTDIEKIQIEGKTFPITFPFRRIDMVVSSDDKKHLATLFEKKVYKNATELLDSAKGYMIAGEECLASEQAWGAYSCAVKHLYKDMQLFISNHEAIEAMSFLASNFYSGEFDFIQAYANANNSHKNFYNGDEKTEVVWLYIRTVENFIKAFSTIDSKIVCASLQEYLPMDYREGKSFGKFMIKKMPKHTKKSIYGVEFVFKYNVGYKN